MHPGALQALEFEQIVGAVRSLALTPLGAARLSGLRPHSDGRRVASLLAATTEGVRYLADNGAFPLQAPADFDATLSALAIEGRPLEPVRLIGLADFIDSVEQTRAAVRRAPGQLPLLHAMTEGSSSFKGETADVREKIDAAGDVVDNASQELRSIRDRLRKHRARLRSTLESFLRGKDTAKYLQEQIVTDRNGRYVLVVKAEHRAAIPGIIHGSSASGASLFLEPLSTVEVNNEVVALEEQEAAEVRRILLALSDAFRRRAGELQRLVEMATELDAIQARARLSRLVGGTEPVISPDGAFELRAARHPLLIEALVARLHPGTPEANAADSGRQANENADAGDRERPSDALEAGSRRPQAPMAEPVPVDIVLNPPTTVLVITGPNTGGKTVALKTAGLLALMAQAGLHIPAAPGSRVPLFRSVFADIGDEQSIAASLSTFSWHVTNIVGMDRALALPALILFDEIGAGTDPAEGGALGTAVIDYFRAKGALVIATTHSDSIKSYASTTAGVATAAFGFDPDTFAPTYRLAYGSPGRSLALEIAGRLGVNPAILAAARQNLSAREAQLAEHLAKIDQDLHALEHERRLVAREHQMLSDAETRIRSREEALRQREDAAKRRLDEQLDERLRQARREIDRVVDELKRRTGELAAEAERRALRQAAVVSTGDAGIARSEARIALDAVIEHVRGSAGGENPAVQAPPASQARPAVGDRVTVPGLGLEGTLAAIHDHEGEVDVQGKRVRAKLAELRVVSKAALAPARVSVNVQVEPRDQSPTDLNVIGCSVDEALARAERFLDGALLTEQRTVRFIHGYGTGQLRRAIAQFLQSHPLVARFDAAPPEQGGGGVTVAELKD
jgi:DNA mismatch repair protein MutS2